MAKKKKTTANTTKKVTKKAVKKAVKKKAAAKPAPSLEEKVQGKILDLLKEAQSPVPLSLIRFTLSMLFPEPIVPQLLASIVMRAVGGKGELEIINEDGVDLLAVRVDAAAIDKPSVLKVMKDILNSVSGKIMSLEDLAKEVQRRFSGNAKAAIQCFALALNDSAFSTSLAKGTTKLK